MYYAFGLNTYGQLGIEPNNKYVNAPYYAYGLNKHGQFMVNFNYTKYDTFTKVSCGKYHTMLLTENNKVYVSGYNGNGRLGLGWETKIRDGDDISIKRFKNVHRIYNKELLAKDICASWYNSYVIDINNELLESGMFPGISDRYYFLSESIHIKDVSAKGQHVLIIDHENNVYAKGENIYGQIGMYTNELFITSFTLIANIKAKSVSAGSNCSFIIDVNDNVWAFGSNKHGQLGLGVNKNIYTPTLVINPETGTNMKAKQISSGDGHTLLVDINNNVYTTGNNKFGQLGLNSNESYVNTWTRIQYMKAKKVAAGSFHSLFINEYDYVYSCGNNEYGQLGLKDNISRREPTWILGFKAYDISAGDYHSAFLGYKNEI